MAKWEGLLSIVVSVVLSGVAGFAGGYWYLQRHAPAAQRVVVLDMARLVKPIAEDESLNAYERRKVTEDLSQAVGQQVDALVGQGVLVLDSRAIVRAPNESFLEP